jgi:soluble lytic murein transglycosylase
MRRYITLPHPPRLLWFVPLLALALLLTAGTPPHARAQRADALANARRLEANGEWEQAEAAYRPFLADGGEMGQAARLELARLYERWERFGDALPLLEALTTLPPTNERLVRAWFQYGSVLQSLGRAEQAVDAYARYIQLGGPAAAYARVESGKILIFNGEREAALVAFAPLLAGQGPENARRVALRHAAPLVESLGPEWEAEALAYHRAHAALATTANERVPSLWQAGLLARSRGETTLAVELFREVITRYPGNGEAVDALAELARLNRPAGLLESALVHYRRRNNENARRLYNQVLDSGTAAERAVALFYLGALAERRNEPRLAIENYGESYAANPNGPLADEALFWRAGAHEDLDDLAAAQADYVLIVERGTDSSRAAEAAFRNGYISYEAKRLDDARRRWQAAMNHPRNDVVATAAYWSGKAMAEAGDAAGAQSAYGEAMRRDPTGYYGLRAAAALVGQPQAPRNGGGTIRPPAEDWAGAEAWLASWAGPETTAAWQQLQASEDWRATWELAEAGWYKIALDAFVTLLGRRADQPWLQYRAGRALLEGGFPRAAYAAGWNIWREWPGDGAEPEAIQRLRYPAPWRDLVQREADRRGLDPLLMYAMMRQESAFDPHAGSSAGAFGLTQFIAGTAGDVARALGRSGFRFAELSRPALAIEFGAYYLAAVIREQDGNVYQGLAAYNGGSTNAERWHRDAGGMMDIDRFTEEIDFAETETYIRLVMENYARYRHLYGAADRPSIVR